LNLEYTNVTKLDTKIIAFVLCINCAITILNVDITKRHRLTISWLVLCHVN